MTADELDKRRQLHLAPVPPPDNVTAFPVAGCPDCAAPRCDKCGLTAASAALHYSTCAVDDCDGTYTRQRCASHGPDQLVAITGENHPDETACPDDPDGVHHVGCGCDNADAPLIDTATPDDEPAPEPEA